MFVVSAVAIAFALIPCCILSLIVLAFVFVLFLLHAYALRNCQPLSLPHNGKRTYFVVVSAATAAAVLWGICKRVYVCMYRYAGIFVYAF